MFHDIFAQYHCYSNLAIIFSRYTIIPGSVCNPVPTVTNAAPNSTVSLAGTVIRYECLPGYVNTGELEMSAEITCDGSIWSAVQLTCTGIYSHVNGIYYNPENCCD